MRASSSNGSTSGPTKSDLNYGARVAVHSAVETARPVIRGYGSSKSRQRQILRGHPWKHLLQRLLVEAVGAGEQSAEEGAVVG